MKHLSANRKNIKPTNQINSTAFTPEILADSLEVMENYCLQKIVLLQSSLEKLNVAENALEIIGICQQIKKEKVLLLQIAHRKNKSTNS